MLEKFEVKQEKFEGPLDLLLKLIEERQLDITRLVLAKVADDYLDYIRTNDHIDLDNLAEFVSIASKIILIKSQSILPTLEITQAEEKEIEDLENQLKEYRKFKIASEEMGKSFATKKISFSRGYLLGIQNVFTPPVKINVFDLKKAFLKVISEIIIPEKLPETAVTDIISLEEKIEHLKETLQKQMEMSFQTLNENAKDKIELIVSFLAMLEMVKQRIISVEQNQLFEDIKISKIESSESLAHVKL